MYMCKIILIFKNKLISQNTFNIVIFEYMKLCKPSKLNLNVLYFKIEMVSIKNYSFDTDIDF